MVAVSKLDKTAKKAKSVKKKNTNSKKGKKKICAEEDCKDEKNVLVKTNVVKKSLGKGKGKKDTTSVVEKNYNVGDDKQVGDNNATLRKKKRKKRKKKGKVHTANLNKEISDVKESQDKKDSVDGTNSIEEPGKRKKVKRSLAKRRKMLKFKAKPIPKKVSIPKEKPSTYDKRKTKERELALDLFGSDEGVVHVDSVKEISAFARERVIKRDFAKKRKLFENEEEPDKVEPKRKAAWVDEDDENVRVMDVIANMTKARGSRGERETSQKKYGEELKRKFNEVYGGTPEWADLDRKPEEDSEDELVRRTGNYLSEEASENLPKGRLECKQMEDLNRSHTEGAYINAIDFNPHLPVGLVGGTLKHVGAATLFQVDGTTNHRIHSVRFHDYYLTCAKFMQSGKKFIAGSTKNPHFYVYDLESSKETKIMWKKKNDFVVKEHFYVSPDGELLVFLGHSGKIFVYDSATLSLIDTMQSPYIITSATFNSDGSRMYTIGDTGEVSIWDMHARECIHKFYDDGCITGTTISMSPNNQYLACGSESGVVNIYDSSSLSSTLPKPVKALLNLTTRVTSLSFNSSSELLAMASNRLPNAFKLVHFPSMTIFENFPFFEKPMKPVEYLQFSPQSGYLAVGNPSGAAQLFRLIHFKRY